MSRPSYGILYRAPDTHYLGIYQNGKITEFNPVDFDNKEKDLSLLDMSAVIVEQLDDEGEKFNINEVFSIQSEIYDSKTNEKIMKNIYELDNEIILDMSNHLYDIIIRETLKDH